MEQIDESVHTATMQAQGTDKRGQGGAKATIVSSLAAAGEGATRVDVSTDYHITGRLARFGRGGMIEDISNRLLGEFAKCLQTSLAGAPDGAGVAAGAGAARADAGGAGPARLRGAGDAGDAGGAGRRGCGVRRGRRRPIRRPGPRGEDEAARAPGRRRRGRRRRGEQRRDAAPGDEPAAVGPGPSSTGAPSATEPPPPLPPMPESEPVQGLSLVGGALLRQAQQNPAPVVALLLGFLLALRVLRRRG